MTIKPIRALRIDHSLFYQPFNYSQFNLQFNLNLISINKGLITQVPF